MPARLARVGDLAAGLLEPGYPLADLRERLPTPTPTLR